MTVEVVVELSPLRLTLPPKPCLKVHCASGTSLAGTGGPRRNLAARGLNSFVHGFNPATGSVISRTAGLATTRPTPAAI